MGCPELRYFLEAFVRDVSTLYNYIVDHDKCICIFESALLYCR